MYIAKALLSLATALVLCFLFLQMAVAAITGNESVPYAWWGFIVVGAIAIYCFMQVGFWMRLRNCNYEWYVANNPSCKRSDGRVKCAVCGSNRITVRNLMNRTFTRAHVCVQCGETLYFSPE